VTFSRESLLEDVPATLEPASTVIQIPEDAASDYELFSICWELAGEGFRFAMDDWVLHKKHATLLELAAVVKVDVQAPGIEEKVAAAKALGVFKGRLLAEGVENQTAHEQCRDNGFELFQGFHYFRPKTLTGKGLPTQSISVVRLLNLLRDINTPDRGIQEAFSSDPALSYKLLHLVNSAAYGGRGIDSIGHAMRLLGREPLYRWLSTFLLAAAKDGAEVKAEIIKSSLTRGRMCELVGESCKGHVSTALPGGETLFLVGLFSQLETLLQMPMEEILAPIDLADGVVEALLHREGTAGVILSAVENYEIGEWDLAEEGIAALGAEPEILSNVYLDSVTWASNRMEITGG
jgi:EAL and modified HD-GYP domain-containing signal transduction protein